MFNSNPGKFLAGLAHRMAIAAYRETQEKTMTNAIEQSKREMYAKFSDLYTHVLPSLKSYELCKIFESALESYLELLRQETDSLRSDNSRGHAGSLQDQATLQILRQELEALHETARKRFEDIQSLEAVNKDLIEQLGNMTERRDYFRNQLQAANNAFKTRQEQSATPAQDSGDRASCAAMDGKTAAILGALLDAQSVMVEYLVPDGIRAKDAIGKMIPILDNEKLYVAMRGFEHPNGGYAAWLLNNDKCMHSFPSGEQCVFCGVGK
jgi:DNA gyrase/topoisomerase IV subunit A